MGRKFILWVLSYAWLALVVGLGLLGFAGYSSYKADHGAGIPPKNELVATKGHVSDAQEVTVERKRRRGGKTTERFFELTVKPEAAGEVVKLRVDYSFGADRLAPVVDETISALYDSNDHNLVYELLSGDGSPVLSFDDMSQLMHAKAEAEKANMTSAGMLGFAAILAVLGGLGVAWRRKLVASGG